MTLLLGMPDEYIQGFLKSGQTLLRVARCRRRPDRYGIDSMSPTHFAAANPAANLEDSLRAPNKLSVCGTPLDPGKFDTPRLVLATQEDRTVPWRSAYRTRPLVSGKPLPARRTLGHAKCTPIEVAPGRHVTVRAGWVP